MKKIIAIATSLAIIGMASPIFGATVAELQTQIVALLASVATLQAQLNALGGAPAGVPAACVGITSLTTNLSKGSSGNDVKCLQAILNQSVDTQVATSGIGSAGNETTYFGPLTKAAVVKYQIKNAISPAAGYVGSITRAKLNTGLITPEVNKLKEASLTDEQLKEEIGQMIMVGFRGTEASENSDIYKIIKDVKIGGVAFSDYDVPSNSFPRNIINPEQTKKLISDLQKYSVNPLFVAIDAEGGNINRLKQRYGFLPVLSPEKMGQDKTLGTTEKESTKLAEELKGLGFNMNLAPVVDLNINPENPIIGALGRSFSSDPEEVVNQSRVFIESHLKNNIITVEKHFPGQGSATKDNHLGIVDVTDTYKKEELFPYQKLNDEGLLNAVMVAHIINKKIDNSYPATLSKIFLQDILRDQMGFKGVIISDDMQMAAISNNYKFDEAAIMTVNAGVDIIYMFNNIPSGYDKDIAYKVRDTIFNAVKENKIEEKRIIESYNRILDLKKRFKIIQSIEEKNELAKKAAEIKARSFELVGVSEALTFGEVLDIAKYVEGMTGTRPAFLLAILQEELILTKKFGLCYVTNFDTGEGTKVVGGGSLPKTMHPERDVPGFLNITKELGKDPLKTPVTCPMSFGWGGAMGPADFIPSTWMLHKDRLQKIIGKLPDPWNIRDAFSASGLYLSDSGAASKTRKGEWEAAMLYFSESINSPYSWYANDVLKIADKLEADIKILEQK